MRLMSPRPALLLFLTVFMSFPSQAADDRPGQAAIASASPLATQAGLDILQAGGNAFDAAITVAAVLGVAEPYSAGIGGGGFWLLRLANSGDIRFVDAREKAPAAAHRDLYLDEAGEVVRKASLQGPLAAGIPGQAAAFVHLAEKYGRLPLDVTLAPAVQIATDGFPIDQPYQGRAVRRYLALQADTEAAGIFLPRGLPIRGQQIIQKDLAETLRLLGKHGLRGFYGGPVAEKMVSGVRAAGGIWTLQDLADYTVVEREPIRFEYAGQIVHSAPPPSSGGVALATILNILSGWDLAALSTTERTHLVAEAMRRAYKDRARFLGDADHVEVPVERLISMQHAAQIAKDIRLDQASSSEALSGSVSGAGTNTTHLSVLDADGNAVSATLSINTAFGSCFVPAGTGVLLNNEMDDFSARPGSPNAYGLIGGTANAIAPGKRPLSSMSPTMIESADQLAILGTPGGSRIISMVLLGALEYFQGKPPRAWVEQPRFHHQYVPDRIDHEPGAFSAGVQAGLRGRGHQLRSVGRRYGNMQAILWDKAGKRVVAASDPRGVGSAEVR